MTLNAKKIPRKEVYHKKMNRYILIRKKTHFSANEFSSTELLKFKLESILYKKISKMS